MLDEPSLGLAPIIVADIFRTIGELRASGVSVLLVEQNAQAALQIADRAYVMELGEFILNGAAKDIATNAARRRELSRLSARGCERYRTPSSCPAKAGHPVSVCFEANSRRRDYWIGPPSHSPEPAHDD